MATQVSSGLIENNAINDAHIANVALTGVTASSGDSSTSLATTAFVAGEINSLIDAAPGALNTLNELAAAMGDDANFSTTITNSIATKAPLASPTFTGTLTTPTLITGAYGASGSAGDGFRLNSTDLYGQVNASDKVRIAVAGDSFFTGGNVGIGAVPYTWTAFQSVAQIGRTGFVGNYDGGATSNQQTVVGNNTYYGSGGYTAIEGTAKASYMNLQSGDINFYTAPVTSAGSAQTFTNVLNISNAGAATFNAGATFQSQGVVQLNRADNARNMQLFNDNNFGTIQTSNDPIKLSSVSYTRFDVGGSEKMRIANNGNVGIGNPSVASSSAKLDVTAGSSASTVVKFGSHYDTTLQMQATATASSSIQYLNASGTSKVAMGYRDDGTGNDGAWRVRHAATLDTAGPYLNMATDGRVSISTDTSAAPLVNSHAQLEIITTTNANPAYSVLAFQSGVGRLGTIEARQRAGGASAYGHISISANAGATGANPMVRAITANYTGKVGVGKGHSITPDMNLELYAYNETSQWTSSGSYHGGTQAFGILSNSPPGPVAGDYGYYKEFWYYMSSNTSHTMVWDNTDSYFNAEVQIVAACTNGGSNNNVYARGFWTNNHTAHKFAVIEGMTQTSGSVGSVIVNGAAGGIGALANGNTFVFTASQGTQASNSGKLTLVHSYPGGSFYGAKIRLRVYFGQFNGHSSTS